jgi:hypothetical protein
MAMVTSDFGEFRMATTRPRDSTRSFECSYGIIRAQRFCLARRGLSIAV